MSRSHESISTYQKPEISKPAHQLLPAHILAKGGEADRYSPARKQPKFSVPY